MHDVIIVGGGLAGMRAAVACDPDLDVALLSKVHPTRSHSVAAQGGINAAIAPEDSWEDHAFDTIKGSDWLGDQEAIVVMCQEAPRDIMELERMGAIFSRDAKGRIAQRPFGGAGFPRTCYTATRTGHALLHTLYEQILRRRMTVYEEWYVTSLIVHHNQCVGVVAWDILQGGLHALGAKAVILATGGYARVYAASTNALINTGDGLSIAYRAGAPLMDMEFVQFHPTTLRESGILLSEAARGEGGWLLNARGERFMARYAPKMMELASRDVVSRAEQQEINEGRGVDGCVLLDLRHLGKEKIMERLREVWDLSVTYMGVDPVEVPVPVVPGAHYTMGGVKTGLWGETTLEGLFAAGECACVSVHGGNRLGGNSLLETIVFGRRAGTRASEEARRRGREEITHKVLEKDQERIEWLLSSRGGERVGTLREELGRVMSKHGGVFRDRQSLERAREKVREFKERYARISLHDRGRIFNTELIAALELGSLLDVAETVIEPALVREESRGAHCRIDFPERDDQKWLKHILVYFSREGPRLDYTPVSITKYPPSKREY